MEKDIPLKIEILSSDRDEEYRITSAREIEFILKSIAKNGSLVALYYSDTDDFILTSILDVDASGVWLEKSRQKAANSCLTASQKIIFVSSHNQVKVQFISDQAIETNHQGMAAFFVPLPKSIHRLQRREYYRLTTPVSNPLLCVIHTDQTVQQDPLQVTIMDISGGGVGLTCQEHDGVLVPGQTYENCVIDLLDMGRLTGAIEVMNLVMLTNTAGETVRRAGCEFKQLDGASTALLQRYVTAMQRVNKM